MPRPSKSDIHINGNGSKVDIVAIFQLSFLSLPRNARRAMTKDKKPIWLVNMWRKLHGLS